MYLNDEKLGQRKVDDGFPVDHLDVERLLADGRWLCPQKLRLIARGAFGDMFLASVDGQLYLLDVAVAKMTKIAESEDQFHTLSRNVEMRELWFGEADEREFALRGPVPTADQCIAFSLPLAIRESGARAKPYIVDIYKCVSFLGDFLTLMNKSVSFLTARR